MNRIHPGRTGVALLRPWPFGPPLRGRAPHRDASTQVCPRVDRHELPSTLLASAPVGGPAAPLFLGSV